METHAHEDVGAGSWAQFATIDFHHSQVLPREYLNGKALTEYFGISRMTLHRWQNGYVGSNGAQHPPLEGFPRPYDFGGFPLWKRSEIEAWEVSRQRLGPDGPRP